MGQKARKIPREIYATDGFDYGAEYLDHYCWDGPKKHKQFAGTVLGKARNWEALGFFAWLYDLFPSVCLAERPGGQISRYFPGNMPASELLEHLREIDMAENEAIKFLQVLERHGILWVVHRGEEILYLELRPPPETI